MTRRQAHRALYHAANSAEWKGESMRASMLREIMADLRRLPGGVYGMTYALWRPTVSQLPKLSSQDDT